MKSGTLKECKFYRDYGAGDKGATATEDLFISYDDVSPQFSDSHGRSRYFNSLLTPGVEPHVRLSVDLTKLPASAWERLHGASGKYYRVHYILGLSFGPGGIEWRFLYDGQVLGSVDCQYIK